MELRAAVAAVAALAASTALAAPRVATEKPGPQKSGFYDFYSLAAESPGIGQVTTNTCAVSSATQPDAYAGNMLLDCDGEVPHNETTIVVNPADPEHAVGGYHSYQLHFLGATVVNHVIGTVSATFDGGRSWRQVTPPITPYQFSGDPALAFGAGGRLWFANIADHEGPGGAFTGPSVVVATSGDGGLTWTKPVTVASGQGAVASAVNGQLVFQDKEFIAADRFAGSSAFAGRAYVTWTSFQERVLPVGASFRSPILTSSSDDGQAWSAPREISGFGAFCSAQLFGRPDECDLNQDSYPTVAPNGRAYVSFENFNTPAENQILVVRSDDGGRSFSPPVRVDTVFDINYPRNTDRRDTLTGCQLRVSSVANSAADPSDPSGNTVYVVWSDNRNGSQDATNADVFLARSTDGGQTWKTFPVDTSDNDQFYPWVSVGPDGRVDVGYMDRFGTGQDRCLYGFTLTRLSFDAAGTPLALSRQLVSTAPSVADRSRWFGQNTRFIGDYNGVAIGPDGSTWSLWTDMRNEIQHPPAPDRNHGQHAVGARTPAP
ncbi:MAG TPA: sialidase family protein [Anaeromyxobacteraceae bacterium]|nr:sialidase family protein [Anaeromyxobacteraceae bacterium]